MIHRIELIFQHYLQSGTFERMTQKNWSFIAIKHDTRNWTSFCYDPKDWTFFCDMTPKIEFSHVTQRIEHFLNVSQRIEPFINMTQRIEPLNIQFDSKNWTLFTKGLKELDPKKIISKLYYCSLTNVKKFSSLWVL